jgi:hypothetical protein
MFHNVKLKVKDKGDFYRTLHKTGAQLPSLQYLANCVLTFLKRFARIFEKGKPLILYPKKLVYL